jgi:hypothetical protein
MMPIVNRPGRLLLAGIAGTIFAALVAWGVSRGVRQPGRDAHR